MNITINMVGLYRLEIEDFINSTEIDLGRFKVKINEKHYETTLYIETVEDNRDNFEEFIREIMTKFETHIYGINQFNIYQAVYALLKLNNKTISLAESVSAGRLVSELAGQNVGVDEIFNECIVCYSKESKINFLNIAPEFFDGNAHQSVETAYEMASCLLGKTTSDFVISTSGYSTSDDPSDPNNGKCFIAVGDREVIHVFKHKFYGTRNQILQQISKVSYLHLINKLKNNDFDLFKI